MARGTSLTRQTFWSLLGALLLVQLITALVLAWFVLKPLAHRTASDLAALMVLSAQTWTELPPETRSAFEDELRKNHQLLVQPHPLTFDATHSAHPLFFDLLESAIGSRIAEPTKLVRHADERGVDWYYSWLPAGRDGLWIAVSSKRVNTSPVTAFFLSLLAGLALTLISAIWLSRRVATPLLNLQASVEAMSRSESPDTTPLHAPQEIQILHERFLEMSRQVNALLTSRTVLFAGLSHDLRSPLARINLGLEMLRDMPSATLIDKLQNDVEHMNALIGQVMELAKGLEHDPKVAVQWREWLTHLVNQENMGHRIHMSMDPNIPEQIFLNPVALQRALGNLLRNAIQYDTQQSPIELRSEWHEHALNVSVLDRGPGIPADKIETMLRPFERMDSARSPAGKGGHGLGLAIVQALARSHGWTFRVQPRPGGGLISSLGDVGQSISHRIAVAPMFSDGSGARP